MTPPRAAINRSVAAAFYRELRRLTTEKSLLEEENKQLLAAVMSYQAAVRELMKRQAAMQSSTPDASGKIALKESWPSVA